MSDDPEDLYGQLASLGRVPRIRTSRETLAEKDTELERLRAQLAEARKFPDVPERPPKLTTGLRDPQVLWDSRGLWIDYADALHDLCTARELALAERDAALEWAGSEISQIRRRTVSGCLEFQFSRSGSRDTDWCDSLFTLYRTAHPEPTRAEKIAAAKGVLSGSSLTVEKHMEWKDHVAHPERTEEPSDG